MKYGRWKRWAKEQQREYDRLKYIPFRAVAFRPPDWEPGDDDYPWLQKALDHMAIGYGGTLHTPPLMRTSKTLEVRSSGVAYVGPSFIEPWEEQR